MIDIKIPYTTRSFYTVEQSPANRYAINLIYNTYKKFIDPIAKINQTRTELLSSFTFLESAGDEKAQTPYAVGLMQISPSAMTDTVTRERKRGKLTTYETEIIKKHVGATRYAKIMDAEMGDDYFTRTDCFIPELNLLLGTMLLMQLVDEETKNGVVRMDRVVIRYNRGYYTKVPAGTTEELLNNQNLPTETKNFILKLLGVRGTLDLLL